MRRVHGGKETEGAGRVLSDRKVDKHPCGTGGTSRGSSRAGLPEIALVASGARETPLIPTPSQRAGPDAYKTRQPRAGKPHSREIRDAHRDPTGMLTGER